MRTERGEAHLPEQGDIAVPFFVVVSGELEVYNSSVPLKTLLPSIDSGQLTGEVGTRRASESFSERASLS